MKFSQEHLQNIKFRFEEETGVCLHSAPRVHRRVIRLAVVFAAVISMLTINAGAVRLFGQEDDLSLEAVYLGDGVFEVSIENRSDVPLQLKPMVFLKQWSTARAIGNALEVELPVIAPGDICVVNVDVTDNIEVAMLEMPMENDCYYLVFTTDYFSFGHGWMCSLIPHTESEPAEEQLFQGEDPETILRLYYDWDASDMNMRSQLDRAYIQSYKQVLRDYDGFLVEPVLPELLIRRPESGVTFDESVEEWQQYTLVGEYFSRKDGFDKLVGTQDAFALVLSAYLPLDTPEPDVANLPLYYFFTYPADQVRPERYAFIHGQLMPFCQMEQYLVFEDESYMVYNMSHLFYTDLAGYMTSFDEKQDDLILTPQLQERVNNIFSYYDKHLEELFYYRDE